MENTLAGIEYVGISGVPHSCERAIYRYLQFGDTISRVRLLSCGNDVCMLLTIGDADEGDIVAVKSGLGPGGGSGSKALSQMLALLDHVGAEISEYDVSSDVIKRLDHSALTSADINALEERRPLRKLPRQADSSIGDFSADEGLGRNVSGGTRPRLSWGRSRL